MVPRRGWTHCCAVLATMAVGGCLGSVERLYNVDVGDGVSGIDGGRPSGEEPGVGASATPASIGGNASGVAGPGLVLQNAGKDDLAVVGAGPFSFATKLYPGEPYDVTVLTQPTLPSQKCAVTNGTGKAAGIDVTNVGVTCVTDAYKVGGSVVGLVGAGLVLQNNGGDDLAVTGEAFSFATAIPSGSAYGVTIKTQPVGQSCNVGGGTGTIVAGDVDSVVINCLANSYTIGGTVSGLAGSLVLQNNAGNDRTVTANGSFAFSKPIMNGETYAVTVKTRPTSPISQTCAVTQGSGTVAAANVTSVKVGCTTNKYTVGGNVTGLTGTVVLQVNGGSDKTITANGPFTFASSIASGSAYAVTVKTQPSNQACQVTAGSGTIGGANVGSVSVKCSTLIAFRENFDGVTAPAIPAGWTATLSGNVPWKTSTDSPTSPPNSMYVLETIVAAGARLESPAFVPESSTAVLSFQNTWHSPSRYGGGVLEISIDGGDFVDIIEAGGVFMSGPYNSTLVASTIGKRPAWTGTGGPVTSSVRLPANAAGKSVKIRWHFVTALFYETKAWRIDDVVVRN